MRAVILIPYRGVDEWRVRNLEMVQRWYAPLGLETYLGDTEHSAFNRAGARNAAARAAGDWDVALFADADTVAQLPVVEEAFTRALGDGRMWLPHNDFWRFRDAGTLTISRGMEFFRTHPEKARRIAEGRMTVTSKDRMPSGAIVISRESWDKVGGQDERFLGWGYEDSSFLHDCNYTLGKTEWMPGLLWHFWHPRRTGTIDTREADRRSARIHREEYEALAGAATPV